MRPKVRYLSDKRKTISNQLLNSKLRKLFFDFLSEDNLPILEDILKKVCFFLDNEINLDPQDFFDTTCLLCWQRAVKSNSTKMEI